MCNNEAKNKVTFSIARQRQSYWYSYNILHARKMTIGN